MTIKKLASLIAKKEGKKKQARIGDIREILSILSDLCVKDSGVVIALINNGYRRSKK
jgi:hypothetical protein